MSKFYVVRCFEDDNYSLQKIEAKNVEEAWETTETDPSARLILTEKQIEKLATWKSLRVGKIVRL